MLERIRRTLPVALYNAVVHGLGWLAMAFLIAPIAIALIMSLTAGQTLRFPPQGLSLRWYAALLDPVRSATEQIAALNSLEIAVLAVFGSFLIAAPAAIGITRLRRRRALVVEPMCWRRWYCRASSTASRRSSSPMRSACGPRSG